MISQKKSNRFKAPGDIRASDTPQEAVPSLPCTASTPPPRQGDLTHSITPAGARDPPGHPAGTGDHPPPCPAPPTSPWRPPARRSPGSGVPASASARPRHPEGEGRTSARPRRGRRTAPAPRRDPEAPRARCRDGTGRDETGAHSPAGSGEGRPGRQMQGRRGGGEGRGGSGLICPPTLCPGGSCRRPKAALLCQPPGRGIPREATKHIYIYTYVYIW